MEGTCGYLGGSGVPGSLRLTVRHKAKCHLSITGSGTLIDLQQLLDWWESALACTPSCLLFSLGNRGTPSLRRIIGDAAD